MTMQKEIFIGFVGGIGVDFDSVIYFLINEFKAQGYHVNKINISDLIATCCGDFSEKNDELKRIEYYMDKGTLLRKKYGNAILSYLTLAEIHNKRRENNKKFNTVYFIKSFKRPEEVDIFRKLYGRNFILFSVHSSLISRKNRLFSSKNIKKNKEIHEKIDNLIKKDFEENNFNQKKHGQNVIETFPKAHVFLNTDVENTLQNAIRRFVDILFGHPFHTPTIDERNIFLAKGLSLRSADLSRQVGVVIANSDGDIIATGCNDVPKFGGGLYEPSDLNDQRDFKINKREEKIELVKDLLEKLSVISIFKENTEIIQYLKKIIKDNEKIKNIYEELKEFGAKVTDILEFSRPVHAEMEAICDAARRGIKLKNSTLYSTTYPCHLCAKLILAVGIKKVVYIDPYPKSEATALFEGVIVDSHSIKHKSGNDFLSFDAFMGISPKRYLHVFTQKNRKEKDGTAKRPRREHDSPYLKERNSIDYFLREVVILKKTKDLLNKSTDLTLNLSKFKGSMEEAQGNYDTLKNKILPNLDDLAEEYRKL
jgi:deoxycytidylate deaminase